MSKPIVLICPVCDGHKVREKHFDFIAGKYRECENLNCGKTSCFLVDKDSKFTKEDEAHQKNEWDSWECIYSSNWDKVVK
jgi:hypothetical protein